jgi:hypothetical protein
MAVISKLYVAQKILCRENCKYFPFPNCQKFSFPNCQNFPFETVKISFSKLLKFSFRNCQNFLFQTVKIFVSKLSKFPFPNCQKFSFRNCQKFSVSKLSKFSFRNCQNFLFQKVWRKIGRSVENFTFSVSKSLGNTVLWYQNSHWNHIQIQKPPPFISLVSSKNKEEWRKIIRISENSKRNTTKISCHFSYFMLHSDLLIW